MRVDEQPIKVLDDGFLHLVEIMGSDESIEESARVSYGIGTRAKSDTRSLLRYLMRHKHCYDAETEVLTEEGFKAWPNVTLSDKLGCWDESQASLVYEYPLKLISDDYQGPMYKIEHGGVDLMVTPNHRMYVKTRLWNGQTTIWYPYWQKIIASELDDKTMVRYNKLAPFRISERFDIPGYDPVTFLELVAFFIGDGSLYGPTGISFHLRKQRKIQYLYELGELLRVAVERKANDSYVLQFPELRGYFNQFYLENEKFIPNEFQMLHQEDATALLNGLKNSDGSIKRGTWTYSSSVEQVAKALQRIALHAGEVAHYLQKGNGLWDVSILSRMREPVINQGKKNTSWEPYKGRIYCAETRTGILVVRRNGKIVLSGNSTPFEMAEMRFRVRVPMDTWRQWIRHRTACLAGDTILQFDLPGGIERRGNQLYTMTVGEVFNKFQPTVNTQRSGKQGNEYRKRDRVQAMNLRCMDENKNSLSHTKIVDIWQSGVKPVYLVEMCNGSFAKMSAEHLCNTEYGWGRLKDFCKLPTRKDPWWECRAEIWTLGTVHRRVQPALPHFDPTTEKWRPIPNWEDWYEVSDQGRVRRAVGGRGSRSFGGLKETTLTKGAIVVSLNRPGLQERPLIHQLVMDAFGPPKQLADEVIRHKDDNFMNCNISNLEWGSPLDNNKDRKKHGATSILMPTLTRVLSIKYSGEEMTYDLEVEGPYHNFSANGIIVHNSVNEYSTRYSEAIDSAQHTDKWRLQSGTNKQGSESGEIQWPEGWDHHLTESPEAYLKRRERLHLLGSRDVYEERLKFGIAREQARKDLPLSTYTEAYWKSDLHNIFNFLRLRMDGHAQLEIREYANAMATMVEKYYPLAYGAFKDCVLDAITLTGPEILVFRGVHDLGSLSKREQDEYNAKIGRLVE